tara:strand:+ start:3298 stop:4023 length:726 start_codon:yes stop_codon:yes gene_type:complete
MNVKGFLVLFFCFSLLFINAQSDTLYVDENNQDISKTIYLKKSKSGLYDGQRFSTDTIVLEKLRLRNCFGELEPRVKSQLFKLLHSRNHIDTTKTLLIHYGDTLRKPSYYIKNNKERKYMYSFAHEHYNTHKGFVLAHKICKNRYRKFKKIAQVLHFYNINNGHPEQYKGHVWYKDYSSLLKKLFLSGYLHSRVIIIRPNGEFFLGYHNHYLFRDVVKNRKWEKSKSEFKNKLEELNQYNQ